MRADYYPSFFEVYVENFFYNSTGRVYTSEQVLRKGLTEDDAEAMVKELRPSYTGNQYISKRKMKD